MVYSAKSDDIGTISQFTRIKYIYVTTTGSSTPANYQVKLTIAYEPEMKVDFGDIRFNTLGNVYIDYWIESKTDSVTATVWIELPDAITDPGSDTIWMYYGNGALSDGGDGVNTFIQYHGVATSEFYDAEVKGQPLIAEFRGKVTAASHNIRWGVTENNLVSPRDSANMAFVSSGTRRILIVYDGDVTTSVEETPSLTVDQYYRLKIVMAPTTIHGYVDGNEIVTGISKSTITNNQGLFMKFTTGTGAQEWSFIREYIANEPSPSYGTSQHQRRVPQFIN